MSDKSGWCIDGLHDDYCKYAHCGCDCHERKDES